MSEIANVCTVSLLIFPKYALFLKRISKKVNDMNWVFPAEFWIPIVFPNFNFNCPKILELKNLPEQVKKEFCCQNLFWPFNVWINCSNDLKNFANSPPSAWNFKSFSQSLEQFFLTVGQNNFINKYFWKGVHHTRLNSL